MNRRSFLQLAGLAAGGFALDPERLLWRPVQTEPLRVQIHGPATVSVIQANPVIRK